MNDSIRARAQASGSLVAAQCDGQPHQARAHSDRLVGVEMEARLLNSRHVMMWSVVALFSASLALLTLALTVLIIFWDTHRLLAAGAIQRSSRAWRSRRRSWFASGCVSDRGCGRDH
jgi:hypothetical protein